MAVSPCGFELQCFFPYFLRCFAFRSLLVQSLKLLCGWGLGRVLENCPLFFCTDVLFLPYLRGLGLSAMGNLYSFALPQYKGTACNAAQGCLRAAVFFQKNFCNSIEIFVIILYNDFDLMLRRNRENRLIHMNYRKGDHAV